MMKRTPMDDFQIEGIRSSSSISSMDEESGTGPTTSRSTSVQQRDEQISRQFITADAVPSIITGETASAAHSAGPPKGGNSGSGGTSTGVPKAPLPSSGTQSPCSSVGGCDTAASSSIGERVSHGERAGSEGVDNSSVLLPEDFAPSDDDVICGRGKKCYSHIGNKRFRERVMLMLDEYYRAKTKLDKSSVLSKVVDQVRQHSPSGGFVKQDPTTGRWFEVGDFLAREKTSQAFRDCYPDQYKSSNVSKKKKRQEDQAKASVAFNRMARSEYAQARIERLVGILDPNSYAAVAATLSSPSAIQGGSTGGVAVGPGVSPLGFLPIHSNSGVDFTDSQRVRPLQNPVAAVSSSGIQRKHQRHQQTQVIGGGTAASQAALVARQQELMFKQQQLQLQLQQQEQILQHRTFQDLYSSSLMNNMLDPQQYSYNAGPHQFSNNSNDMVLARGVGRTFSGQLSDPGPRTNRLTDLDLVEDERNFPLHRSLPEIDFSETSYHSTQTMNPFMDREQFEKMCNSLPNIGQNEAPAPWVSGRVPIPNEHSYSQCRPHEQLVGGLSSDLHDKIDLTFQSSAPEKISVNLNSSMYSDFMVKQNQQQQRRKSPLSSVGDGVVEFDPIRLDEMKRPASTMKKKSPKARPVASAFQPKLSPLGEAASNLEHSSGSSSPSSRRLSKDFLECIGKMTDHTIVDDNPFEPIPMSTNAQAMIQLHQQHLDGVVMEAGSAVSGLEDMEDLEFHEG